MKLCVDCKFFNPNRMFRCTRRHSGYYTTDLVDGGKRWVDTTGVLASMTDPDDERASILPWKCGKKARYHEPRAAA